MRRVALFDLDFTLLPHDTMFLFANFVLRRRPWRLLYLFVFAPFVLVRLLGLINEVPLKRAFFSFLWRMRKDQVDQLAREFVERDVMPRMYPEMLEILKRERAAGHELVLNTASPTFFVQYIASALGFDHSFASPLEIPERVPLLPRFTGPNNKGQRKIEMMREAGLLKTPATTPADPYAPDARDPQVALAATDSTADLPMLALAERGLLIHPDRAKFERKTGRPLSGFSDWTIYEPERPYSGRGAEYRAAVFQMLGLYGALRQKPTS